MINSIIFYTNHNDKFYRLIPLTPTLSLKGEGGRSPLLCFGLCIIATNLSLGGGREKVQPPLKLGLIPIVVTSQAVCVTGSFSLGYSATLVADFATFLNVIFNCS